MLAKCAEDLCAEFNLWRSISRRTEIQWFSFAFVSFSFLLNDRVRKPAMAMRRTGNLVQRNKATSSTKTEVDPAIDLPEQDDETETKETRLTLMEEILLLGLKDREVSRGNLEEW